MTPEEAAKLQAKYRRKRNRWARDIGRPIPNQPDPGELDLADDEEG